MNDTFQFIVLKFIWACITHWLYPTDLSRKWVDEVGHQAAVTLDKMRKHSPALKEWDIETSNVAHRQDAVIESLFK